MQDKRVERTARVLRGALQRDPLVRFIVDVGAQRHGLREIRTHEHNARVYGCRPQRDVDLFAGVQTHAGGTDDVPEGSLVHHELPGGPNAEILLATVLLNP